MTLLNPWLDTFVGTIPTYSPTREVRVASNLRSAVRPAAARIMDVTFSSNFGTEPSQATVKYAESVAEQIGDELRVTIGDLTWYGIIVSVGISRSTSATEVTVQAVDHRIHWKAAEIDSRFYRDMTLIARTKLDDQGNLSVVLEPRNPEGKISGVIPTSDPTTGKVYLNATYAEYIDDQAKSQRKLIYWNAFRSPGGFEEVRDGGDRVVRAQLVSKDTNVLFPGEIGVNVESFSLTRKASLSGSRLIFKGAREYTFALFPAYPDWPRDLDLLPFEGDNGLVTGAHEFDDPELQKENKEAVYRKFAVDLPPLFSLDTSNFQPKVYVQFLNPITNLRDLFEVKATVSEELRGVENEEKRKRVVVRLELATFDTLATLLGDSQVLTQTGMIFPPPDGSIDGVKILMIISHDQDQFRIDQDTPTSLPYRLITFENNESVRDPAFTPEEQTAQDALIQTTIANVALNADDFDEGTVTIAGQGRSNVGQGIESCSWSAGTGGVHTTYQLNNKRIPLNLPLLAKLVGASKKEGAEKKASELVSPLSIAEAQNLLTQSLVQVTEFLAQLKSGGGKPGDWHNVIRDFRNNRLTAPGEIKELLERLSNMFQQTGPDQSTETIQPGTSNYISYHRDMDPLITIWNDAVARAVYNKGQANAGKREPLPEDSDPTAPRRFVTTRAFSQHGHADAFDGGYAYAVYAPEDDADMIVQSDRTVQGIKERLEQADSDPERKFRR